MKPCSRHAKFSRVSLAAGLFINVSVTCGESPASPLSPQQELATFHFADPNLTAELIAAEPDIVAPVAIAWDADGRLFVAEMTDYPSGPVSGRIRLLEDRDGDGRYERATVFAENIAFPNGVMPWNGGVLVTAAPDILFFKDNDGDGHADERRVLFTGFAEGNQQLRVNGLFWGLDNWIYGANGRSDGDVRRADDPSNKKVSIRRRDFRFRPGTKQFEAISGHSQFGCAHDDWGNRFPVFNNIPIRHVVIEQRYLNHQPFLAGAETVVPISAPDDKGRVYYLAPPTLLIPQASDYFTSACGPTVYRGDALGPDYRGNFFVCEPVHNLIQRRRLVPNGATFVAERTESGKDFLASTDPWFHGVFTATGPDGCLYVVDFYRKFVEHPAWVADELKNTTPWRTGEQHGRIWRIHPKDWNPKTPKPNLNHARSSELIKHLDDANGWWRDTAQRLLVERQDRSVVRALEKVARKSPSPPGRLHALYTLDGLGALSPDSVLAVLKDSDSHVREHAIRLVEPFLVGGTNAPASRTSTPKPDGVSPHQIERIKDALFGLVDDKDLRVRFQLALTIGGLDEDAKLPALAHLAQRDAEEPWTALAVLTGVGSRPWLFWRMLGGQNPNWLNDPDQTQAVFLDKLAGLVGNAQNEGDWREAIKWFDQTNHPLFGRLVLFNGLAESARSVPPLRNLLDEQFIGRGGVNELGHQAYRVATDQSASLPARVAAVRVVGRSNAKAVGRVLIELLKPEQSTDLQAAAVKALAELNDAALSASAVAGWEQYSRATRQRLVAAAPRTGALADALLTASEQGKIQLIE